MKKVCFLFIGFFTLILVGCKFLSFNSQNSNMTTTKEEETSTTTTTSDVTSTTVSTTTNSTTSIIPSTTTSITPTTSENTTNSNTVFLNTKQFNNNLKKDGPLTDECMPSLGSPKVLVFPINFDSSRATNNNLEEIKIAFTGIDTQTGWESVRSYYYKSSYGKLDLNFEVVNEWYTPRRSMAYYNQLQETGTDEILADVLKHYDSKFDYSQYDYDNDGYIDSVWLIYNCPVEYEDNNSIFWAYTSWTNNSDKYDFKEASYYAWAGIDFIHDESAAYDTENIKYDSHTFVHETGHLLGLDDYYDYNKAVGPIGGLYGADMMDYNIGDHGALSKLLLGWISPTVVTGEGSITLDLEVFGKAGECLMISDHDVQSIYDEYILIEYYTSSGLNYNDQPFYDLYNDDVKGIKITHVDAHKCLDLDGNPTSNDDEFYPTEFLYDNSGTEKLMYNLLKADGIINSYKARSSALYTPYSSIFGSDYWMSYKYHSGSSINFTLKVNSLSASEANITIVLK